MYKLGAVACGSVLLAASFMMLWRLGDAPLAEFDEGTYAEVLDNSYASGDFLSFSRYDKPWLEKPPLYFWLAAASEQAFGHTNFALRLPSALAGIGVVALVIALVRRLSQSHWAAAGAGLLLLLTPPFVAGSRTMLMDILVSFFILLAAYSFLKKKYWIYGAAVGLALLSKSAIAIFAIAVAPVVALWSWDFSWLKDKNFWFGVALAALVSVPWHLYETVQFGSAFWQDYLGRHVIERFDTNLFGDPALKSDYLLHLTTEAPLISGLFVLACLFCLIFWKKFLPGERLVAGISFSMAFLMLFVFFAAQTHAFSYLLPVYPFAAISIGLVAYFLYRISSRSLLNQ